MAGRTAEMVETAVGNNRVAGLHSKTCCSYHLLDAAIKRWPEYTAGYNSDCEVANMDS